jgi:acetyltransferase
LNIHLNIFVKKKFGPLDTACNCTGAAEALREPPSASMYPGHYEKKVVTRTGVKVFMRPIKPEDAPMLLDLFNSLSSGTRYYRFFTPLKVLPRHLLIRFTQIDYNKDMALVAFEHTEKEGKILAVARYISKPNQSETEFAVVVRDEWQGKGVGRVLLENLIVIARKRKIESMIGFVLSENIHMLSLARKLGFHLSKLPGENQYFLKIDLNSEAIDEIKGD